jgi:D-alanyl-D-alanine carboxypeptidase
LNTPDGIDEINAEFGNIFAYEDGSGHLLPTWESEQLALAELPFPLMLSWNHASTVQRIAVHKLLVTTFETVFAQIVSAGLQSKVTTLGGAFSFRPQRTGAKLSAHAWGIAIDLNPETNQQGELGDMDPAVVKIFTDNGFEWGGIWVPKRRDSMHFQFCTGY